MESKTPLFKATKAVKKDIVIEDRNKSFRKKVLSVISFLIVILVLLAFLAPRLRYFGSVTIPGLTTMEKTE